MDLNAFRIIYALGYFDYFAVTGLCSYLVGKTLHRSSLEHYVVTSHPSLVLRMFPSHPMSTFITTLLTCNVFQKSLLYSLIFHYSNCLKDHTSQKYKALNMFCKQ